VEQPNGCIVTKHYDLSLYYLFNQALPVGYNIGSFDTFHSSSSGCVSFPNELNAVHCSQTGDALRPLNPDKPLTLLAFVRHRERSRASNLLNPRRILGDAEALLPMPCCCEIVA
jgi:hypothetical protein